MTDKKANLFLCAAPRSGSTQLAAWLGTHPDITLASIKEPNFFSSQDFDPEDVRKKHLSDVDPATYVKQASQKTYQFAIFRDEAHYDYLFSDMTTAWRLDASTSYLQSAMAPDRILEYNPDAMIVILTRHPVERALSHYRLARQTGRTRRSLEDQIDAELNPAPTDDAGFLLRFSQYDKYIKKFRDTFTERQVVQLKFEDLVADPHAALARLAKQLQVDPKGFDLGYEKRNSGDAPRFPKLNTWATENGLKTKISRAISPEFKRWLQRVMFTKEKEKNVTISERAALSTALLEEVEAYNNVSS